MIFFLFTSFFVTITMIHYLDCLCHSTEQFNNTKMLLREKKPCFEENSRGFLTNSEFQITVHPQFTKDLISLSKEKYKELLEMAKHNNRGTLIKKEFSPHFEKTFSGQLNGSDTGNNVCLSWCVFSKYNTYVPPEAYGEKMMSSPALFYQNATEFQNGWVYTLSGSFYRFEAQNNHKYSLRNSLKLNPNYSE